MSEKKGFAAMALLLLCVGCSHLKPNSAGAPPVAGTPAPEQNFIVFFSGDETGLTAEAQAVVAQIATDAKTAHPKRITVTGEDDGGTAHDAEIATTRGEHVASALITAGLDAASIVQVPGVPPPNATGIVAHKVVVKFES